MTADTATVGPGWRRACRARRARVLSALMALAATAVVVPIATDRAVAQTTSLRLVSQKLVIAPAEELDATLAVNGPIPPGAEVTVTVSSRLRSPVDGLHSLLDEGGSKGGTVDFLVMDVASVQGPGGRLNLKIPTVRRSRDDTKDALRFSAAGLYPVTFELRTAEDDSIASLLTFVDRSADVATPPLAVSLVTAVNSPPAGQPDGTVHVDEAARSNLEQLVAALEHNPKAPTTVSLPPELLDRLGASPTAADQDLIRRLAAALAGREVLSRPYVAMDPSSAAGSSLSDDYTRMLAQGEDTLRRLLPGPVPDRSLYLADRALDEAGAQLLRNLGTLNVVLGPTSLEDQRAKPATTHAGSTRAPTTQTVQMKAADGSSLTASVLDPAVLRRITSKEDPVLAAYHLVAQLVAIQSENGDAPGRGIVVQPPTSSTLSTVFLGTLEDQLARIPQLRPVALGTLFQLTAPMRASDGLTPARIPLAASAEPAGDNLSGQVTERRVRVQQVASMLPGKDPLSSEMRQLLDLSLADDNTAPQRAAYLSTVDSRLGAVTGSIVSTNRRRFTITSKHSTIPITVRTTWNEPLKVKLRLSSPKLNFPTGDQIITVDKSSPPFRVPVEARTNGTFKVTAALLTPQGDALLGPPDAITVRSTALSGLGLLVTIGAALVLVAWWLQNLRSRRRQKLEAAAAERHPTAPINRDTLPTS